MHNLQHPTGSRQILTTGKIPRRSPAPRIEPAETDADVLDAPLPDCIDCGLPFDACECETDPGAPDATDLFFMRVDQAYNRIKGK